MAFAPSDVRTAHGHMDKQYEIILLYPKLPSNLEGLLQWFREHGYLYGGKYGRLESYPRKF